MSTITNGTVSRKIKPADYEERTVGFSFVLEPGDDVEKETAKVLAMAERLVRGAPSSAAPARASKAAPSAPTPATAPSSAAPATGDIPDVGPTMAPVGGAASTQPTASSGSAGHGDIPDVGPTVSAASPGQSAPQNGGTSAQMPELTDKFLRDLANATVSAQKMTSDAMKALVREIVGRPDAKTGDMDQTQRATFVARIKAATEPQGEEY